MKIYKSVFIIFLLVIIFFSTAIAQENNYDEISLNDFDFLIGKWETDFGKFKYYEEWEKENDKYIGQGFRVKEGKQFDGEKLVLINIYGYISYIATVGNQQPILFALIESENNKYVFENKEHDFPQRVIYNLINENSITVFVEGEMNGKLEKDEYNLTRVKE